MDKMKIDEKTALVLEGGGPQSVHETVLQEISGPAEGHSRQECRVQQDDGERHGQAAHPI